MSFRGAEFQPPFPVILFEILNKMTEARSWFCIFLLGALLSGCSGGADGGKRVTVYRVKGVVKLNGGPIAGATVAFGPKEGQPTAMGRTNDSGEYTLTTYDSGDGAAKGIYTVTVIKIVGSGGSSSSAPEHGVNVAPTNSHDAAKSKSGSDDGNLVPAKYGDSATTPLSFKVEEKDNVFDIEIK